MKKLFDGLGMGDEAKHASSLRQFSLFIIQRSEALTASPAPANLSRALEFAGLSGRISAHLVQFSTGNAVPIWLSPAGAAFATAAFAIAVLRERCGRSHNQEAYAKVHAYTETIRYSSKHAAHLLQPIRVYAKN